MRKIKRRRNFRFLQSINVCLQILLWMILLIESHIQRCCDRRRRIGNRIAVHIPAPSSSTIIRNYMGMLFVDDSTSLLQSQWLRGYFDSTAEHKIHRMNARACARCSVLTENYYRFYLLCPHREGAKPHQPLRRHNALASTEGKYLFVRSNDAERITIINGQCTPCDLEAHGELESFAKPAIV